MARPPSTVNVPSLDQQIDSIGEAIQARHAELNNELNTLSETYTRITGHPLGTSSSNGRDNSELKTAVPTTTASVTKTKARKKRLRKEGVSLAWIQENLGKPMTVKQLQAVAEKGGRSGLSVMNVLRANKNKFKTSPGQKKRRRERYACSTLQPEVGLWRADPRLEISTPDELNPHRLTP